MNLLLQLKVSDENTSNIESIDLRSFEMRFPLVATMLKLEFGRIIANLVVHMTPIHGSAKRSTLF